MPLGMFALYNALGGSIWVLDVQRSWICLWTKPPAARPLHRPRESAARDSHRARRRRRVPLALVRNAIADGRRVARRTVRARVTTSARMSGCGRGIRWSGASVSGRFAQGEYLAVHLVTGFVASLAVIALFASITEGLVDSSPLTRFDVVVADRLNHAHRARRRCSAFQFAEQPWRARRDDAAAASAAARLRGAAARARAHRAGAPHSSAARCSMRRCASSCAAPSCRLPTSSSSTGAPDWRAVTCSACWWLRHARVSDRHVSRSAGRAHARRRAAPRSLVVGDRRSARLYLGQHYVSDASAGLAAGLLWLTTCVSGIEIAQERRWRS